LTVCLSVCLIRYSYGKSVIGKLRAEICSKPRCYYCYRFDERM